MQVRWWREMKVAGGRAVRVTRGRGGCRAGSARPARCIPHHTNVFFLGGGCPGVVHARSKRCDRWSFSFSEWGVMRVKGREAGGRAAQWGTTNFILMNQGVPAAGIQQQHKEERKGSRRESRQGNPEGRWVIYRPSRPNAVTMGRDWGCPCWTYL